jgi:hypothetical protein
MAQKITALVLTAAVIFVYTHPTTESSLTDGFAKPLVLE